MYLTNALAICQTAPFFLFSDDRNSIYEGAEESQVDADVPQAS
jgi:hypothetical protein